MRFDPFDAALRQQADLVVVASRSRFTPGAQGASMKLGQLGSLLRRWLLWLLAAFVALQLFFVGRIALMAVVDPQSTAFQRSEAWRLASSASGAGRSNGSTTSASRPTSNAR